MKKILILTIAAFALASCGNKDKADNAGTQALKKPVKTIQVKREVVPVEENYTATINAYDKVYLAPN
ncbi:MAG: hypothetical protein ACK5L5_11215, partial [Bacteroidales bacterium]